MLIDHIGFLVDSQILRIIGRLAYPAFGFLVAYHTIYNTRDRKRYISRLLVLGAVSQFPHFLFIRTLELNVVFTLAAGVSAITITVERRLNSKVLAMCIVTILLSIFSEYGCVGVFFIWSAGLCLHFGNARWMAILQYAGPALVNLPFWLVGAVFSTAWGALWNKLNFPIARVGRGFFYAFYPVHMIALYGLSLI